MAAEGGKAENGGSVGSLEANHLKTLPMGTEDAVGRDMRVRQHLIGKIQGVFERFGFEPHDTPIIENEDVFRGHYGKIESSTFRLEDRNGNALLLRPDLTVPLARVVASHPDLPMPYRRYQIGLSFRDGDGENFHPRQFTQCDADVVGSDSRIIDAEFIMLAIAGLMELGFGPLADSGPANSAPDFIIRINHRGIFRDIASLNGPADEKKILRIQRAVSKFKGRNYRDVKDDLLDHDIESNIIDVILKVIALNGNPAYVLDQITRIKHMDHRGVAFTELSEICDALLKLPYGLRDKVKIDLSLVREFNYYSGFVMEGIVTKVTGEESNKKIVPAGDYVLAGGRYDGLIGKFGAKSQPAAGMTFELENIIRIMKEFGMLDSIDVSRRRILLSCGDKTFLSRLLAISNDLRADALEVVTVSESRPRVDDSLAKEAASLGCPVLVYVDGMVSVKRVSVPGFDGTQLYERVKKILTQGNKVAVKELD